MNWIDKVADLWDQLVPPPPKQRLSIHPFLDLDTDIVFREKAIDKPAASPKPAWEKEKLLIELRKEMARSRDQLRQLEDVIQRINSEKSGSEPLSAEIKIEEKAVFDRQSYSNNASFGEIEINLR